MKGIIQYIRIYLKDIDKAVLAFVTLLTSILVFINYYFGLDNAIRSIDSFTVKLFCWAGVFIVAFLLPHIFSGIKNKNQYFRNKSFLAGCIFATLLFSLKLCLDIPVRFSSDPDWNNYWNHIAYWPLLLLITGTLLYVYRRINDCNQPFYGLTNKDLNWTPYLLMLLIMLPLIAAASTQHDFQAVYPKLKTIATVYQAEGMHWWHKLLFELSYGSDFVSIELFFRGFLILGFIKWAGKDAILPMACFYCTIHFGKPLGECISSYFGGALLGIVVYNTRSIYGGLIVHLGIAWMMELAGFFKMF